jgi:hypothetical protein
LLEAFWKAHFTFVRDASLAGARALETVYQRTGALDLNGLPLKDYAPSLLPLALVSLALITLNDWFG